MFVDASAIVAILTREPEADALADVLESARSPITSPIATLEAVLGVCRKRHASVEEAEKDVREFLSGMTRALEKGSLDSRGGLIGATTATEFYWFLLLIGPRLQYEVRSLRHMHQVCRRIFGQRAGDLKTTEKRCQRIGLAFGKPGRPKKMERVQ